LAEYRSIRAALESQPRGTVSRIALSLYEDEAIVFLVRGREAGPRVWVQAALHGDEYDGIVACLQLIEQYAEKIGRGDLFLCPIANPTAFLAGTNPSPKDCVNMNRVFHPGLAGDSYSYRYGRRLLEEIASAADFFVDLHGGGKYLDVCPFAMIPVNEPEAYRKALQALKYVRLAGILERADDRTGLLIHALAARGIPAVLLESGGGQAATDPAVNRHLQSLLAVLTSLGMLKGEIGPESPAPESPAPCRFRSAVELRFEVTGLLRSHVPAGSKVKRGDVLLEITTYPEYGKHEVICEVEQGIVLSIHTASLVRRGDYAVMMGIIQDDSKGRDRK
jgi:predicted deacylase